MSEDKFNELSSKLTEIQIQMEETQRYLVYVMAAIAIIAFLI